MEYCKICGTKLIPKYLKNEGEIPFCQQCDSFRFPQYNVAVSMVIYNPQKDKILLIQQYGRKRFVLVAGYVNLGESAEDAVAREVKEEVGLELSEMKFNKSEYFDKSNTLMINFACVSKSEDLSGMTEEVDHAQWFTIEEAKNNIFSKSLAEKFMLHAIEKQLIQ